MKNNLFSKVEINFKETIQGKPFYWQLTTQEKGLKEIAISVEEMLHAILEKALEKHLVRLETEKTLWSKIKKSGILKWIYLGIILVTFCVIFKYGINPSMFLFKGYRRIFKKKE